jgi:hypothetical protein
LNAVAALIVRILLVICSYTKLAKLFDTRTRVQTARSLMKAPQYWDCNNPKADGLFKLKQSSCKEEDIIPHYSVVHLQAPAEEIQKRMRKCATEEPCK